MVRPAVVLETVGAMDAELVARLCALLPRAEAATVASVHKELRSKAVQQSPP